VDFDGTQQLTHRVVWELVQAPRHPVPSLSSFAWMVFMSHERSDKGCVLSDMAMRAVGGNSRGIW
jgi:hypothetical protein